MIVPPVEYSEHGAQHAVWTLKAGEVGAPYRIPVCANRTVHIAGDLSGATVAWTGRNVAGAEGVVLDEVKRAVLFRMQEAPVEVYPAVLGGAESTEVVVHIVCRKNA